MAMKALRGMVNGAMSEITSAVSGNRPTASAPASSAAAREHVMAVKRDYISQPRLSESNQHYHRDHHHHHHQPSRSGPKRCGVCVCSPRRRGEACCFKDAGHVPLVERQG